MRLTLHRFNLEVICNFAEKITLRAILQKKLGALILSSSTK